ncbi:MAG TPA: endopeptidase La [Vicinamibacterales bacterium]|nr:endopeptidase La [Vicinamibacterales bacterium]HPW19964.1 endopeptidase La [Vicinamibacterales bacterium]
MSDPLLTPLPPLPPRLPVVPLLDTVVFPLTLQPLAVNRAVSIDSIHRALGGDRLVVLVQQHTAADEPGSQDLRGTGTAGLIRQMARTPAALQVAVEGLVRVRVSDAARAGAALDAAVEAIPDDEPRDDEIDAYVRTLRDLGERALAFSPAPAQDMKALLAGIDRPLRLCYLVASLLDLGGEEKQRLLEEGRLVDKLRAVAAALARNLHLIELKGKIESDARQEMNAAQRESFLRQQLKAIREELGESDGAGWRDLQERIEQADLPEHVRKAAEREARRLERAPQASPEHQMIRTYLDWLLEVPWSVSTEDRLDPAEARRVLDEDHYDLDRVKDRIVEYLAVRKLKGDMKGPVLCFAGPPGVGKTSLGQSIARSMNRRFVRIALGGVRDEAEIRGHRRTYIGALPGRIVQGLKQAGSMNPVVMLDEIDKLTAGYQGDPAAALLEVLDPAQNHAFRDHYLEVACDLSRVLFIANANQLGTVHRALLDRMEIIGLAGYTDLEKRHIARRFLIPRQLAEHGLPAGSVELSDEALGRLVREYTREAGVRGLEREIGAIARKVAARVATSGGEGGAPPPGTVVAAVAAEDLQALVGPPRFRRDVQFRTSRFGVATGVAWTESGGDVLFIEAMLLPAGHGQITLTGHLGSVMQESARAAVSHLRATAASLGLPPDLFKRHDLHVHVPAGAIPKDGPSAGVTMATAILSAIRRQAVRPDLAMTGEITLSGAVLPVGGIREKVLAARRYGVTTFVLPDANTVDLPDLPEEVRSEMTFVPVTTIEEVLALALPTPEAAADRSGDGAALPAPEPAPELPGPGVSCAPRSGLP